MFNKIAEKYDLLNNLMTFGLHKKWKEEAIKLALKEKKNPENVLDICSGTGDLAIIIKKLYPDIKNTKITCIDNSSEMVRIAEKKFKTLEINNINILLSSFEDLSKNSSYDLITIGFGLRNLIDKEAAIEKIYDLLNTGGIFACIDLGHPNNIIWQKLFFFYFFKIVPKLGAIFARDKEAYTYLPASLMSWYKQEELKNIILKKGFQKCYFKNILGGAVAIHVAVK